MGWVFWKNKLHEWLFFLGFIRSLLHFCWFFERQDSIILHLCEAWTCFPFLPPLTSLLFNRLLLLQQQTTDSFPEKQILVETYRAEMSDVWTQKSQSTTMCNAWKWNRVKEISLKQWSQTSLTHFALFSFDAFLETLFPSSTRMIQVSCSECMSEGEKEREGSYSKGGDFESDVSLSTAVWFEKSTQPCEQPVQQQEYQRPLSHCVPVFWTQTLMLIIEVRLVSSLSSIEKGSQDLGIGIYAAAQQ